MINSSDRIQKADAFDSFPTRLDNEIPKIKVMDRNSLVTFNTSKHPAIQKRCAYIAQKTWLSYKLK